MRHLVATVSIRHLQAKRVLTAEAKIVPVSKQFSSLVRTSVGMEFEGLGSGDRRKESF